jgi:hypothetical protein
MQNPEMSVTLRFEVRETYNDGGKYSGKYYIGVPNRCGVVRLFLRTDGTLGDVSTKEENCDQYYYDSKLDAENAVKYFIERIS